MFKEPEERKSWREDYEQAVIESAKRVAAKPSANEAERRARAQMMAMIVENQIGRRQPNLFGQASARGSRRRAYPIDYAFFFLKAVAFLAFGVGIFGGVYWFFSQPYMMGSYALFPSILVTAVLMGIIRFGYYVHTQVIPRMRASAAVYGASHQ